MQRVIDEEVSPADSFEELMQGSITRNDLVPINPSRSRNNDSNSDTPTNSGSIGGGGGGGGNEAYIGDPQDYMSPYSGRENYMQTQAKDDSSRHTGTRTTLVRKDYTHRQRGNVSLVPEEEDSLSTTFGFIEVGDHNYNYGQNPPIVYPPYSMYQGESDSSSWAQQEASSSNEHVYGQITPQIPPPDPYGWHVGNYMQGYSGELSWADYSSQYTYNRRDDTEDSDKFEPARNSMWY